MCSQPRVQIGQCNVILESLDKIMCSEFDVFTVNDEKYQDAPSLKSIYAALSIAPIASKRNFTARRRGETLKGYNMQLSYHSHARILAAVCEQGQQNGKNWPRGCSAFHRHR